MSESQAKSSMLNPATVEIMDAVCTTSQMPPMATVTFIIKVIRDASETVGQVTAQVGNTPVMNIVEQTNSPVENPTGTFTHGYDATADGVPCGETHTITANAAITQNFNVPADSVDVTCGAC